MNSAGRGLPGNIDAMPPDVWERIVRANLLGTYFATRAVWPHFRERGGGVVVNLSSGSGRRAHAGWSAYCASKFGVMGLTDALQKEGRPLCIRVNAIWPGPTDTDQRRANFPDEDRETLLRPEHVARVAVFLASDEASWQGTRHRRAPRADLTDLLPGVADGARGTVQMDMESRWLEDLIRVVGEERTARTPEDIFVAEQELCRMLGGTEADYVRRERRRGKIMAMLGLFILLWCPVLSGVFLTDFLHGEVDGADLLTAGFAILVAFGIAAFVFRRGWRTMRRREQQWESRFLEGVPFFALRLRRREPRTAPWPENLILVIGPERASHPPEELQEAEDGLRALRTYELERAGEKLKSGSTVAIAFGLYLTLGGLLGIAAAPALLRNLTWLGPTVTNAFSQKNILPLLVLVWMVFNAGAGASLFVVGLGLRRRAEWARKAMEAILWGYLGFGLALERVDGRV